MISIAKNQRDEYERKKICRRKGLKENKRTNSGKIIVPIGTLIKHAKDTEGEDVDALNCVLVVKHVDSLITA